MQDIKKIKVEAEKIADYLWFYFNVPGTDKATQEAIRSGIAGQQFERYNRAEKKYSKLDIGNLGEHEMKVRLETLLWVLNEPASKYFIAPPLN